MYIIRWSSQILSGSSETWHPCKKLQVVQQCGITTTHAGCLITFSQPASLPVQVFQCVPLIN